MRGNKGGQGPETPLHLFLSFPFSPPLLPPPWLLIVCPHATTTGISRTDDGVLLPGVTTAAAQVVHAPEGSRARWWRFPQDVGEWDGR